MDKLYLVKIGGAIVDNEETLQRFLDAFAAVEGNKILVHGGGKSATRLAQQLNLPQQMVEGRRITDGETLKIVTAVYAGLINKTIVAALQGKGCQAFGLCGADGNSIRAHKRNHPSIDYGHAGDVDEVNNALFQSLLNVGLTPVCAPITHDGNGGLLNTNADTIAQELARSLAGEYEVTLIYSFEKAGVLLDVTDEASVIPSINRAYYEELKREGLIFAGMLPKLDNAFAALDSGVKRVVIGDAQYLSELIYGKRGTTLHR